MRKKTHEEVTQAIAAKGHRLLSETYDNSRKNLEIACPVNHTYKMPFDDFVAGRECQACSKEQQKLEKLAMVQNAFSNAGYTLLAERYDRNNTRMDCVCNEGHEIKMDWASFQDGTRCIQCSRGAGGRAKKLTASKKAKATFEGAGYQLLDEYTDSHTPMKFICPNGHQSQMSWTNFDSGCRCAYCSKTNTPVDPDKVRQAFDSEGFQLLDKYTNSKKRLRFICPQGHKYSMTWQTWNGGIRCAICSGKVVTRKDVRDAFGSAGYTLLSQYRNDNTEKLDFICDQGHEHKITWADFRAGYRCIFCSSRAPVEPELVEQTFLTAGYTPLSKYQDSVTKISYLCPKGHQDSMLWQGFKQGNRCPRCQGMVVTHEDVEIAFAAEGYELLDTYKNSSTHLRYICPEGHQHSIVWGAFKQGHRCAYCAGQIISEEQKEINVIKHRVGRLVQIYLKRQEAQKPFSISGFSGGVARSVHKVLGNKPDGCHLDHIIPQAFFDFRKQDEIEACWHIDNLRYIPALENMTKGHRLTIEDVKSFSESQLRLLAKASRKPPTFNRFLDAKKLNVESVKTKSITPIQLSLDL
jgi:transcription initiation factor IIE alpha subunit